MIAVDEAALICDFAETYHIYDYKSLPLSRVAIFAVGLRENSRIKMKMNDMKYPLDITLLASITDRLTLLAWMNSKDGTNGVNRPASLLERMMKVEDTRDIEAFDTPEEFEKRRNEILRGGGV